MKSALPPLHPFFALLLFLSVPPAVAGQAGSGEAVRVSLPGHVDLSIDVERHRGFGAFPARALEPLGWRSSDLDREVALVHRTGIEVRFRPGSPFVEWEGEPLQMVHAPYRFAGRTYLPLQFLVDLLPGLLPEAYRWDAGQRHLAVEGASADAPGGAAAREEARRATPAGADAARRDGPPPVGGEAEAPFLVVIDPGHGGHDEGAVGPGGSTEKEVALAVSLALARELEGMPGVEVRLTRDEDVFVPLWERGAWATEWKGDRPGVFLSIHANALPNRPDARGFETYFLSEARTEHERRVAAAENAPLRFEGRAEGSPASDDPLLAEIIRDLRTFDHQHWSALLAEIVQEELGAFHPGPDRGVKQGPFAVITNAMMPSVLIEVGFITNRHEEVLMGRPEFHRDSARSIARAVERFFRRYPPGGAGR
jgi:N-acetylmuramoyl-L-alanine amidase